MASPASSPRDDTRITVYTDGACTGNPGPGGWAAIIIEQSTERIVSGADVRSTNQRMELMGALAGLRAIAGTRRVAVYSDSAYVVNCFRDGWWRRWERGGWRNSGNQPVANRDLWEPLLAETRRHQVTWHKVRGHAGDPLNERADELARAAIAHLHDASGPSPGDPISGLLFPAR